MEFTYPSLLLGLLLLIPLGIGWMKWRWYWVYSTRGSTRKNLVTQWALLVLKGLIIMLLSGLLAGPSITQSVDGPIANGIDIVLLLDLSKSMLAGDIAPSRIEAARNALRSFVLGRSEDRIGLIGFAGQPFTLSPLSFDTPGVLDILSRTGVDTIQHELPGLSGSALGDGLLLASQEFWKDAQRERVVIVITDGEANTGVSPRDTLETLKEQKIRVYTIGVGDPRIDGWLLQEIAQATGGTYANMTHTWALEMVQASIEKLEKNTLQAPSSLQKKDLRPLLWVIVCVLLILVVFVEQYSPTSLFWIRLTRSSSYTPESYNYRVSSSLQIVIITTYLLGSGILGYATWSLWYQGLTPSLHSVSLIVDVSRSMLVADISTGESTAKISRLDLAKQRLAEIVDQIPAHHPISLAWFGGSLYTLVPATLSRDSILTGIEAIRGGSIPGGSNLSWLTKNPSKPYPTTLIVTDGAVWDHSSWESTLSSHPSSEIIPKIILIGSEQGGPIPIAPNISKDTFYLTDTGDQLISVVNDREIQRYFPRAVVTRLASTTDRVTPLFTPSTHLSSAVYGEALIILASILLAISLLMPARFPIKKHA